jgi:hypothetical protein
VAPDQLDATAVEPRKPIIISDEELEEEINMILAMNDFDGDGYIEWTEYKIRNLEKKDY